MIVRRLCAAASALLLSSGSFAQTAPPAAVDLDKVQAALGNWSYRAAASGTSEADFIDGSGRVRLIVRCSRATRQVSFIRSGVAAAAPSMAVTTSYGTRILASAFAAGNLSAAVAGTDPLLDQIAFSRGKWAVANSGDGALVVPSWADATRVVEDCRS